MYPKLLDLPTEQVLSLYVSTEGLWKMYVHLGLKVLGEVGERKVCKGPI